MFCRNCGKEMRDDAKFCPSCGAVNSTASGGSAQEGRFQQPVPVQDTASSAGTPGKRRGAGLLIGAGVAAVAVIALLVVAVSGLFASPKGRVEKAVAKTVAAYSDANQKLELPDLAKLSEEKSTSARARIELKGINSQLVGYDLSSLNGLGLQLSSNYDGKGRKMDMQMSAFWDDDEIAAFQMLFDDNKMYMGSPQFSGDTFFGMDTVTLGEDLADLSGDDSVGDLSFNIFDLADLAAPAGENKEAEKAVKEANKALIAAIEVKKTGSETMDINGKSTKTTAYHVVIPQDAMEDYVDAMEGILSEVDYMDTYEEILKATGMPKEIINEVMAEMKDVDIYGELADSIKDALDELGDVELDVYLSGGYVSAVVYEDRIQGTKVEIGLYLGGGDQYVDNLSLEIESSGDKFLLESSGNHTGKGGEFTDKTTFRLTSNGSSLGRLTSEMSYKPKEKGNNFLWEVSVDSSGSSVGSLEMEGQLATTKNSLDLKLEEVSLRSMGVELFSVGLEYYVGPCKGMDVAVKSPQMIADMDEDDLMDLAYDIQENAQDWAADMQDLFGNKIPEELLWYLMYYVF